MRDICIPFSVFSVSLWFKLSLVAALSRCAPSRLCDFATLRQNRCCPLPSEFCPHKTGSSGGLGLRMLWPRFRGRMASAYSAICSATSQ